MYFTFQFYHFPPTTSEMAYLAQAKLADDPENKTCLLVASHPMKQGAGVWHGCSSCHVKKNVGGRTDEAQGFTLLMRPS